MFKYFYFLILSSFLGAISLTTVENVPLKIPFLLKSTEVLFDDSISYTHQPLLSCSPRLNAVYKIESSKILKIIPKTSLKSSSEYNCSYKNKKFSFKTIKFNVEDVQYLKKEKILRLTFNDKIDKNTILKGIELIKVDKLSKTKLKYKVLHNQENVLVIKILESLNHNTITLQINQKLKTIHLKSLDKNFEKKFNLLQKKEVFLNKNKKNMKIFDEPQMVSLENGKFAFRIFLDDTLNNKLQDFIEIKGIDNFEISDNHYIGYSRRKKFGVSNQSHYYHDVISDEFKANKHYRITLKKGLQSYRELKSDKIYNLTTKDRAKTIIFSKSKSYISNKGEVTFSSINIEKATLVVEKLVSDNLRYFLNFNYGNKDNIEGYTEEVYTKELTLDNEKNRILKQKFLLSDLNQKKLPFGVYKITLRYSEMVDNKEVEHSSSKTLFISDLGIAINLSKNQAFISVLSLSKAKTMENVHIEIYAKNNVLLATSRTNEDGIAIISKKDFLSLKPVGLIVRTKNDTNFLSLYNPILSPSFESILKKKERFKAHLYFQSKIVRPASKINSLITVKDNDFLSAEKLPIKIIFKEQHGKVLESKIYHTDAYGLINFSYQLDVTDKTGNYTLSAYLGDKRIGEERIKVEAFMPPKIENTIKSNKNIYKKNELIEVNVTSAYLFGAPASRLNGKVTLNARPTDFFHKNYSNYIFTNSHLEKKNISSYLEHSEDIILNDNGEYSMVLSTTLTQKVPSILEVMLGVTIMDEQPVSNYKKVKIYPYKEMVGLKINSDSFEKGESLEGKAILINPLTGKGVDRNLFVTIKKIKWHYDYSDDNYHWNKEMVVIDKFTIKANETFSRKINENGDFIIEVNDYLGGHSSSLMFDVWWWSYSNISPKNDLKSLEIDFEDKHYSKGESLNVKIKSPILEGKILLTLESSKVEKYTLIDLHKGVAKINIPLDFDLKRGVQLHAVAYRASSSSSNLIPFRAIGYKFIKSNRNEHRIKIENNLPKTSKSNNTLSLTIKTDKPSKVLVSIVDRGILQLVNQKRPKIFDYFNEEPLKGLSYYDLYDNLMSYLSTGKLVDFGAGDMLSKKKKHLAPDLGKRVKPFMIWSGILDLTSKENTFNIKIPEFNGRASVVIVAINKDSIGVSQQDIKIKDDVMIKPLYPKYALAGDIITVPIRIFNTTNIDKNITLNSKLSSNLLFKLGSYNCVVKANSSKLIQSTLNALSVGRGNITLYANYNDKNISNNVELPIYSPYIISTKTFKGITNKSETFKVPSKYKNSKLLITISDNLIGALRDDLKYLVQYPYGCAEQTSSKLSAMHYAKAFLKNDKLLGESENFIRQGIKKLYSMQNYYGEFNYWKGGSYVHAYASLYASQILLEMHSDGVEVPKELLDNSIKMLKSVVNKNGQYKATYSYFHRLYAGFILAEQKQLSVSSANMLYEKGIYKNHFLATFYMAAIRKMQGNDKSADELFSKNSYELARYAYKSYGNRTGNFESNVRDLFLHFFIKSKYFAKDPNDLIVIQKEFTNLYSTQTKATALKAISTYLGNPKTSNIDVDLMVNGELKNYQKAITFTLDTLKSKEITIVPKQGAVSYSIELIKHLPRDINNKISNDKEISIRREFIDAKGSVVDLNNLIQGDKIYSKVTIVNYGEIKNVVVAQRVPACLSIENSNITNQKVQFKDKNINQEYREIRDDRVLHFINLRKKSEYSHSLSKRIVIENRGTIYTGFTATSVGECRLPALLTEAMYDTRITAYAKEAPTILVKPITNRTAVVKSKSKTLEKEKFLEEAKKIVKSLYITEMNSNDELEFSKFFHYPMSIYFNTKNAFKEDILMDKKKYFKSWSKRIYNNIIIELVESSINKVELKIIFDYAINNGTKVLKGKSKHYLILEKFDGKILISRLGLRKLSD